MRARVWAEGMAIALCLCGAGVVCVGQAQPAGFEVPDLQLVSTASRPDWSDRWTAPVEAATILAWFAQHGYPKFLPDLNEDRVVNELDTIELADRFGKKTMETTAERGTTDALLVYGLAKYVAEKYPDTFELKIYDVGFPVEFHRDVHLAFGPDVIPGITLTLKPEPTYAAYQKELRDEEGVIIGIEREIDRNYYLAGRSFLLAPTGEGLYAVDLAWAEDDLWQSGIQGQILRTLARETDALYLSYQGDWVTVEFMLALSPKKAGEGLGTQLQQTACACCATACRDFTFDISTGAPASGGSVDAGPWRLIAVPAPQPCGAGSAPVPGVAPAVPDSAAAALGWVDPSQAGICATASSGAATWVGDAANACAPKEYVYELTFCLCEGFTNAKIEGCLWADNDATIELNGPATLIATPASVAFKPANGTSVLYTNPSYFQAGLNTLTVKVHNEGLYTGMLFVGSLTVDAGECPAPVPCCPDLSVALDAECTCEPAPSGCTVSGTVHITNNGSTPVTLPLSITVTTSPAVAPPKVLVVSPPVAPGTTAVPFSFPCNAGACSCANGGFDLNATLGIPGCPSVGAKAEHICCPSEPQECPDLAVDFDAQCACDAAGVCTISGNVTLINNGATPYTATPVSVVITTTPPVGGYTVVINSPIVPGPNAPVPFSFPCAGSSCSCASGGFDLNVTLQIPDCPDVVGVKQHVCCSSQVQACPPLAVEFSGQCTCKEGSCQIIGKANITNNGPLVTVPFWLNITTNPYVGSYSAYYTHTFNQGWNLIIPFSFPCTDPNLAACDAGVTLTATVDLDIPGCPDIVGTPRKVCCESFAPGDPCPDVTVKINSARCTQCSITGARAIWVEFTVTNLGSAPTPGCWPQGVPCCLELTTSPDIGSSGMAHPVPPTNSVFPLAAYGGSYDARFVLWLDPSDLPTVACQPGGGGGVDLTVTVNGDGCMQECPEGYGNNTDTVHLCCWGTQWEGVCAESCPDLTIESVEASCECETTPGFELEPPTTDCEVTARVRVMNIGTVDAGPFRVSVDSARGDAFATVGGLAAGGSRVVEIKSSFDCRSSSCHACPLDLEVTVDARGQVAECDETNNAAGATVCCR